jgi:hypothetical protein
LAASILYLLTLGYFVISRPVVVATISGTRNVQWALSEEKRTVGTLLKANEEIALDAGTLHLTFARGGQVALHGPARFRVESEKAGRLIHGGLSAFGPKHAIGFTIHSAGLAVVSIGTEFHIDVIADKSGELQVFDDFVEVRFDEQPRDAPADTMSISQGRAYRFDVATGNVKSIDYNKSMRLPRTQWLR